MQATPVTLQQLFSISPSWVRGPLMKAVPFGQVAPWAPACFSDGDLVFDMETMNLQELRIDGQWYYLEHAESDLAYLLPHDITVMIVAIATETIDPHPSVVCLLSDADGVRLLAKKDIPNKSQAMYLLEDSHWREIQKRIPCERLQLIIRDLAGPDDGLVMTQIVIRPDTGSITEQKNFQYGNVVISVAKVETETYDSILFTVFHVDQLLYLEHTVGPKGEVSLDGYLKNGNGNDYFVDMDIRAQ